MPRLRQHVNPLALTHLGVRDAVALPPDRPVEVELGCGDGQFLFERAAVAAGAYLVGVEIRPEWVARIRAQRVPRVTAVRANLLDAEGLFPDGSITRLFVNFPDPWFKRRQQRRRNWLTAEAARALAVALRPGGEVFLQSDVFDVALEALAVLEGEPLLGNAAGEWRFAPANPYGARSRRETWCEERGLRVWRLRFVRRGHLEIRTEPGK